MIPGLRAALAQSRQRCGQLRYSESSEPRSDAYSSSAALRIARYFAGWRGAVVAVALPSRFLRSRRERERAGTSGLATLVSLGARRGDRYPGQRDSTGLLASWTSSRPSAGQAKDDEGPSETCGTGGRRRLTQIAETRGHLRESQVSPSFHIPETRRLCGRGRIQRAGLHP